MRNKIISLLVVLGIVFTVPVITTSCTEQQQAKQWGGEYSIDLPKGKKLVNVTWKDADLWYVLRDMRPDEEPETYTFQEDSNFDIMEGTIIIKESK